MNKLIEFINAHMHFTAIILGNMLRVRKLVTIYKARDKRMTDVKPAVIQMFLKETTYSGGLSDRLRGAISLYRECKRKGLPFKIYYEALNLSDYLEPNLYDWRIKEEDVCFNMQEVSPCTVLTYNSNLRNRLMCFAQRTMLRYYISKQYKQIHVYTNAAFADNEYYELHRELFKPTLLLQQNIDYHLKQIGGAETYIAMVYRFRSLMGDFKEGGNTLYGEERERYLNRCIECVKRMHEENFDKRILVTSDSTTFLSALKELDYVYIIPGNVVHISVTLNADKLTYMKSFIDYYMLSYASTIYLVCDTQMYHSGFAFRAAKLGRCEYKEIVL